MKDYRLRDYEAIMQAERDAVPRDYGERIGRSKIRAFHNVLAEAASRVHGPSMIISTSVQSDYVCLQNRRNMEPTNEDLTRCAFVPKNEIGSYAMAYLLYAVGSDDFYDKIIIQDSFICPAGQIPSIVKAIDEVANYDSSDFRELPYFARVIMRAHPSLN